MSRLRASDWRWAPAARRAPRTSACSRCSTKPAFPSTCIAGASIGAAYGAAYAAGAVSAAYGGERPAAPLPPTSSPSSATASGSRRQTPIGRAFFERFDGLSFADLRIPFAAVASDLFQRRPVVIRSGPVLKAVEASIAVPLMAAPVRYGGRYLIDGGFWEHAPVRVVGRMGAEKIVEVVLGDSIAMPRRFWPLARRLVRALDGPVAAFRAQPGGVGAVLALHAHLRSGAALRRT